MATDWNLIRELMAAAIGFAEAAEKAGYGEEDRGALVSINGKTASLYDVMVSAYTLPEAVRYRIIGERHDKNIDAPYVSEFARILKAAGEACSELVGAAAAKPAEKEIRKAIAWYGDYALPAVQEALSAKKA